MEFNIPHDTHDGTKKLDISEPVQRETVMSGERKHHSSADTIQVNKADSHEHGNVGHNEDRAGDMDVGEVNLEASVSADDVIRAGGYGARDDISSFLPVASDSTDFEASLRDARDYEEPQIDICRPGLGWKDVKDQD